MSGKPCGAASYSSLQKICGGQGDIYSVDSSIQQVLTEYLFDAKTGF